MISVINSSSHVMTNFTYYDDVAAVPKPEPLPDWPVAKRTWRWCWVGHVYGFGCLYVLVAAFASLVLINLNRRLRFQPLVVAIDVFLFLFGLSKSIFLFGDAYHSAGSMPDAFVQVLHGLTFPIVIATYSLLETLMSRLMRVPSRVRRAAQKKGHRRIPGSMALWVLLTAYFLLVVGVYAAASKRRRLRYLLVLTQAIFITWGFVLCFMFTYNSFVAARYAKETGRALRQIVTYCRVRKQLKQNPNARHSSKRKDLHRIDRPAFDGYCEAVVDSHGEEGREASDTSSAESFVFYNEASLTLSKEEMLNSRRTSSLLWNAAPQHALMNQRRLPLRCKRRESDLVRSGGRAGHASMDSDDFEEGGDEEEDEEEQKEDHEEEEKEYDASVSVGKVVNRRTLVSYSSKSCVYANNNNNDHGHRKDNSEDGVEKALWVQSRNGCTNPRHHGDPLVYLELLQCHPLARTNHAYRQDSESQSDISTVEGCFQSPLRRSLAHLATVEGPFEAARDNGYMADAEVDSPKPLRKEQHRYCKRKFRLLGDRSKQDISSRETKEAAALDERAVQPPGSPPPPGPYSLPATGDHCSLGLNRIRQGRLIKKVFTVAYLTTAAEFIMCIVQVYALFGVFGVFSNVLVAAPWPWLAFQTIARASELVFALSIVRITNILGNQPRKRRKKRLRRQQQQQQQQAKKSTTC